MAAVLTGPVATARLRRCGSRPAQSTPKTQPGGKRLDRPSNALRSSLNRGFTPVGSATPRAGGRPTGNAAPPAPGVPVWLIAGMAKTYTDEADPRGDPNAGAETPASGRQPPRSG